MKGRIMARQSIRGVLKIRPADRLILFALAIALTLAGLLIVEIPEGNVNVEFERWKVATQFVWTAVIGGLVGLLYRKWESSASKRQARQAIAMEFYKSFSACHSNYKKARRALRTHVKNGGFKVPAEPYKKAIADLNDAQLECESLKFQAGVLSKISGPDREKWADIEISLRNIESYLNDAVKNANSYPQVSEYYVLEADSEIGIFASSSEFGTEEYLFSVADMVRERLIEIMTESGGPLH
jgi:hypothetical protein